MNIDYSVSPSTPAFVERNDMTDIYFFDNIIEMVETEGTFYKFDVYRISVPTAPGLQLDVTTNYSQWLEVAKNEYYKLNTQSEVIRSDLDTNTEDISTTRFRVDNVENEIESLVQTVDELGQTTSTQFTELSDSFTFAISKSGGNNLIKNAPFYTNSENQYSFWQTVFDMRLYKSETPPGDDVKEAPSPEAWNYHTFWYCETTTNGWVRGTIYAWDGSDWVIPLTETGEEIYYTLGYFETMNVDYMATKIIPYENSFTRNNSTSGRFIKFDGSEVPFQVEHIFVSGYDISLDNGEEYITLSGKINSNVLSGNGLVGIGCSQLEESPIRSGSNFVVAYENYTVITPDTQKGVTDFQISMKIPTKGDLLKGELSATPISDITKIWLVPISASAYAALEFSSDLMTWVPYAGGMPVHCLTTDTVFVFRPLLGIFYNSNIAFNDYICRIAFPVIAFYPGFDIVYSATEPTPRYNMYWGETDSVVKRAKYENGEFVEWETTNVLTADTQDWLVSPPFPVTSAMPLSGYFEVADLKLEYGTTKSAFTLALGEVYSKAVNINDYGIQVVSKDNIMTIDASRIESTYGNIVSFKIDQDWAEFENLRVRKVVQQGGWVEKGLEIDGRNHKIEYKEGD